MSELWTLVLSRWWGRALIVLLTPLWVVLACAVAVVYGASFLVWAVVGPPIVFIVYGKWIDPDIGGNWMREKL